MRKLTINLPPKYRLEVKLTKSRELEDVPLIPDIGKVLRVRKGSKLSRFFVHIFEHKKAKKILPLYFAAIIGTSAYMPRPFPATVSAAEMAPASHIEQFVIPTVQGTRYPVDKIAITTKYSFFHPGIDFDGITGDPIYPFMTGKIELIERSKVGYGISIIVNHGNGYSSRYAHLSKVSVEAGQQVDINTVIGRMGNTGRSFGDHLHFEIYEYGKPINPMNLMPR